MKLAVIGSRTFNDYELLKHHLNKINKVQPITAIVSGGAKGADKLSERYAKEYNIPTIIFYPDWNLGKHAGFLRNADIITEADKVIAFHDGVSKGTLNSISIAKKQNKKVRVVIFNN